LICAKIDSHGCVKNIAIVPAGFGIVAASPSAESSVMTLPAIAHAPKKFLQESGADSGNPFAAQQDAAPQAENPFALPADKEAELSATLESAGEVLNEAKPPTEQIENPFGASGLAVSPEEQLPSDLQEPVEQQPVVQQSVVQQDNVEQQAADAGPAQSAPTATGTLPTNTNEINESTVADATPTLDFSSPYTLPALIGAGVLALLGLALLVRRFSGSERRSERRQPVKAPLAMKLKDAGEDQDAVGFR